MNPNHPVSPDSDHAAAHKSPPPKAPVDRARLTLLRSREEERQQQRAEEKLRRDLEELELIDKYEQELGRRGVEFQLLRSDADGLVVIKRLEEVAYKKFKAALDGPKGASHEDHYDYVAPGVVFPERETFDAMIGRRPHIVVRLANAMLTLHGAKESSDAGKF